MTVFIWPNFSNDIYLDIRLDFLTRLLSEGFLTGSAPTCTPLTTFLAQLFGVVGHLIVCAYAVPW